MNLAGPDLKLDVFKRLRSAERFADAFAVENEFLFVYRQLAPSFMFERLKSLARRYIFFESERLCAPNRFEKTFP